VFFCVERELDRGRKSEREEEGERMGLGLGIKFNLKPTRVTITVLWREEFWGLGIKFYPRARKLMEIAQHDLDLNCKKVIWEATYLVLSIVTLDSQSCFQFVPRYPSGGLNPPITSASFIATSIGVASSK